jgi:Uma2 family endonuclease
MELYANNEVPEYWIANPDSKSVEIFFLKNAKYESKGIYVYGNEPNTFNSIQFPDLSIDLETLYSDDGF